MSIQLLDLVNDSNYNFIKSVDQYPSRLKYASNLINIYLIDMLFFELLLSDFGEHYFEILCKIVSEVINKL